MTKRILTPEQAQAYLAELRKQPCGTKCVRRKSPVIHLQNPRAPHPWPLCREPGLHSASTEPVVTCQKCLQLEARGLWSGGRAWQVTEIYRWLAWRLADLDVDLGA